MRRPTRRAAIAVLLSAALFAGCSSDGEDADAPADGGTASPAAPTTEPIDLPAAVPDVEALMASFLEAEDVPGVLVGLQVGDAEPVLLAAGIDDVRTGEALVSDRVFRIGSVTKPLVAAALMAEVRDGDLRLDEALGDRVDGVTNPEATLGQILAHDGGLADWDVLDGGIRGALFGDVGKVWTTEEVVGLVGSLPPNGEPGSGFHYSNPGYQLLAAVIEDATGGDVADAIADSVTGPLGMQDTVIGPLLGAVPERLIHGWGELGGVPTDNQDLPADSIDSLFSTTGAGYSSLEDLLVFTTAFWEQDSELVPEGVDVTDDVSGDYGLATQFLVPAVDGVGLVGHTGDISGARTLVGHDRSTGISVVIHVNSNLLERQPVVDLADRILATLD